MYNELRYQAKKHAISEKLSKENVKFLHLLPHFFFIIMLKNKTEKNKKNMLDENKCTNTSQHV
jgi:hypothetical protein